MPLTISVAIPCAQVKAGGMGSLYLCDIVRHSIAKDFQRVPVLVEVTEADRLGVAICPRAAHDKARQRILRRLSLLRRSSPFIHAVWSVARRRERQRHHDRRGADSTRGRGMTGMHLKASAVLSRVAH